MVAIEISSMTFWFCDIVKGLGIELYVRNGDSQKFGHVFFLKLFRAFFLKWAFSGNFAVRQLVINDAVF